jgi:hypothetical protein
MACTGKLIVSKFKHALGTWKITDLYFISSAYIIGPNEWLTEKTFCNEQDHQEHQVTILLKTTAKRFLLLKSYRLYKHRLQERQKKTGGKV